MAPGEEAQQQFPREITEGPREVASPERNGDEAIPESSSRLPVGTRRRASRRRRRSRPSRDRGLRAKIWLVVVFAILRGADATTYVLTPEREKATLIEPIVMGTICSAVLLAAIWYGKDWARYVLIAILLYSVSSSLVYGPSMFGKVPTSALLLIAATAAQTIVAILLLAFLSDIKRLTEPRADVLSMPRRS